MVTVIKPDRSAASVSQTLAFKNPQKSILPRNSTCLLPAPSTRPLTTPTVPGTEMLAAGFLKLGWLNASDAEPVRVNRTRSVIRKVLAIEMFWLLYPGPSSTNAPEFPSVPNAGRAKI